MKRKDELALERIKCCVISEGYTDNDTFQDLVIIENSLNDYYRLLKEDNETTKKLKALEIIKNKEINIHTLLLHLKRFDSQDGYNALVGEKYKLTQEEYELLKEVLL